MGLFSWIFGTNKISSDLRTNLDFEMFKVLGEDGYKKIKEEEGKEMQVLSDLNMERRLRAEAYEQFKSWDRGTIYIGVDPLIYGCFYEIYNEKYAKYLNEDAKNEFRNKEYQKIKEEAINNVRDWEIQNLTDEIANDWLKYWNVYTNSQIEAFKRKNNL